METPNEQTSSNRSAHGRPGTEGYTPPSPWAKAVTEYGFSRLIGGEPVSVGQKWEPHSLRYDAEEDEVVVSVGWGEMRLPPSVCVYIAALVREKSGV